jgi:hypothetical protein
MARIPLLLVVASALVALPGREQVLCQFLECELNQGLNSDPGHCQKMVVTLVIR